MIRLILAVVLLLLSLLVLFRAPTNFFWRVAVAVTEFPYVFFLAGLFLFVSCFWSTQYKMISIGMSGLAMILYSLPVFFAYQRGACLPEELANIFPCTTNATQLQQPFSLIKMFSGIGIKEIVPQQLVYKQVDGKNFVVDFYSATEKTKVPCVIVIHGGSWSGGDEKQLPELNSYLANRGYHVAAINYRLAPLYRSPAPAEDTKAAMEYLIANAERLHIDTNNFVLLGRSAGGQIALVSAYSFHDAKIKGVIAYYAPADMVWGATIKSNPWVLNTEKVFADYLGGSLKDVPQKYSESSSCEYVDRHSPPTLLIHGKIDPMVAFEHNIRLQKKLNACGVKSYFLDLPIATHGCDYNINGPSGQIATYAVERFIASVVGK